MIDPVSMARLKTVHPVLDATVCLLNYDFEVATGGDSLIVAQCLRRWSDQQILWERGRDTEGRVVDAAQVVTNSQPGYSWHEYGLAVDLVPKSLVRIQGWAPESPLWKMLTDLAEKRKLTCGACWIHQDLPHVQLTGRFGISPDAWVRGLFLQSGIEAVWKASGIVEA